MTNVLKSEYPFFFLDQTPPEEVKKNTYIEGKLHFAGVGSKKADVMFVAASPLQEEEKKDNNNPGLLRPTEISALFQRLCRRAGFGDILNNCYYTTISKFSIPSGDVKPIRKEYINWSKKALEKEIDRVQPKIIVCLGKHVFNYFFDMRVNNRKVTLAFNDAHGGFFKCDRYNCVLYCMDRVTNPRYQPHQIERFRLDLETVYNYYKAIDDVHPENLLNLSYSTLDSVEKIKGWVDYIIESGNDVLSVDCEWAGRTYLDGKLRSIQFCWESGKVVYLKFYDENGDWVLGDTTWDDLKELLKPIANFKWIGHNICADLVWMEHWLGFDTHGNAIFDTMYAESVVDEYADQKLERLALKYTDLGRYDIELSLWKKANASKQKAVKDTEEVLTADDEGYGSVPDSILIPYACKDVDVVMRAYPILTQKLRSVGIESYYYGILLPFVTDAFRSMIMTGLPVNEEYLKKISSDFSEVFVLLQQEVRKAMVDQAKMRFMAALMGKTLEAPKIFVRILSLYAERNTNHKSSQEAYNLIKPYIDATDVLYFRDLVDHLWISSEFNLRSNHHMVRWLFSILKLTPIKSTKGANGISMPWDKIEGLPDEEKKKYTPATDKQTLQILAVEDRLVEKVLHLNAVGNLIKSFLAPKGSSSTNAIINWIQTDGRLHCNYSCTETGRPRSWKPNVLNYPKIVSRWIFDSFEKFGYESPGSVRSCIQAPEGWCFVDADLDTAEVLSLAYISNDIGMIDMCHSRDEQFALVDAQACENHGITPFVTKGAAMVRTQYLPYVQIPEEEQLETYTVEFLKSNDLLLGGELSRPKRDMHWEMAEGMQEKSREVLDEDMDRGAGKVGMFSIPYGAQENLLEREIETMTGKKPPEETGKRLMDAYEKKFPQAAQFLKKQEDIVLDPGYYKTISGRVRHFHANLVRDDINEFHGTDSWGMRNLLSPLHRESRNYPMQEMVAASMMRAQVSLLNAFRQKEMQARPMIMLYDALVVLCPESERWKVRDMMHEYMSEKTSWTIHDRNFRYTIDVAFSKRWGAKLTNEEKYKLYEEANLD
jgi:uracil-DNA glycosylase family 4